VGSNNMNIGMRTYRNLKVRLLAIEYRFLYKEHPSGPCKSAHKMLRPLEHKVPSQMGKANQVRSIRFR
jgi:hypothetical protein